MLKSYTSLTKCQVSIIEAATLEVRSTATILQRYWSKPIYNWATILSPTQIACCNIAQHFHGKPTFRYKHLSFVSVCVAGVANELLCSAVCVECGVRGGRCARCALPSCAVSGRGLAGSGLSRYYDVHSNYEISASTHQGSDISITLYMVFDVHVIFTTIPLYTPLLPFHLILNPSFFTIGKN